MKDMYSMLQGMKPDILMVFAQIAFAAVNIIYKLAINDGMSMRVATAYRLICAAAFTVPIALIFDRKKRPKITWSVLSKAFLCGLFGYATKILHLFGHIISIFNPKEFGLLKASYVCKVQSMYKDTPQTEKSLSSNTCEKYLGEGAYPCYSNPGALALTSATFMLAVVNLIPAITFIMAVSSGMDKLNLGLVEGKAKVIGTIMGIGGAMMMIFFKGLEINIWSSNINLLHPHQHQNGPMASHHTDFRSKLLGVPCALASSCSFSLWFITQAKLNKEYPSHNSSAALMATMGAIQATIIALCVDRDWNQWKLHNSIRILTVVYPGVVVSGIVVMVIAWCIRMRGPLFVSIFNPLQLLLVVIAAYLMLDEKLYLGSMLGAMLIVCGLYAVLWGQSKEMKMKAKLAALDITKDSENVELVVMPMPIHRDNYIKSCLQNQASTTKNVNNDQ